MKLNEKIKIINTDFLVIGTGIAGLYTALKLSTLGKVIILTKEQLEDSNTQFAQGGIAAVLDKGDSWRLHMKDTIKAGAGLCNRQAVEVLVTEGPARVKELIRLGTSFDHIEGELDLTQEGAHSRRRILHARGDATGVEIRESLTKMILRNNNIDLEENTFMIELLSGKTSEDSKEKLIDKERLHDRDGLGNQQGVCGILAFSSNIPLIYKARAVILASGGCSRVFSNTSNPPVTTGDGIAAAYRVGADIMDMEFVQFHPTTFYNPSGPSFLISESVRGEGAVLRNKDGKRFMPDYHHLADLAPRDIVARSIVNEAKKDGRSFVYLDVTELDSVYIKERFPTIFKTLKKYGLDMRNDLIPIVPAAHYLMGGVKTDTYGHSNLKSLYACGEVACTGVHGANRLASNSLLEGLVFGHRIYESIKGQIEEGSFFTGDIELNINDSGDYISGLSLEDDGNNLEKSIYDIFVKSNRNKIEKENMSERIRKEFRELMTEKAGIERSKNQLIDLNDWIIKQVKGLDKRDTLDVKDYELRNMLTNGMLIARAALSREESRGAHYRCDCQEAKKDWSKKHIIFNTDYPEGKDYVLE